jgi:hypothetical protein
MLTILPMIAAYVAFYAGPTAWLTWLCWKYMMAGNSEWFCSMTTLIMQAVKAV